MEQAASTCSQCGKFFTGRAYPNKLCQSCYNYFRKGCTINQIPDVGTIQYDYRGYVVCHICGRAYKRLGSHIKESHNMTIAEYKNRYGLCNNAKTTEGVYSAHMRALALYYEMPKRLIESGRDTRIKPGERHLRYGKKSRLQECLDRSSRNKNTDNHYIRGVVDG